MVGLSESMAEYTDVSQIINLLLLIAGVIVAGIGLAAVRHQPVYAVLLLVGGSESRHRLPEGDPSVNGFSAVRRRNAPGGLPAITRQGRRLCRALIDDEKQCGTEGERDDLA